MSKLLRLAVRAISALLSEELKAKEQNTDVAQSGTRLSNPEELLKSIEECHRIRKELKKQAKTDTYQDVFDAVKTALQNPL